MGNANTIENASPNEARIPSHRKSRGIKVKTAAREARPPLPAPTEPPPPPASEKKVVISPGESEDGDVLSQNDSQDDVLSDASSECESETTTNQKKQLTKAEAEAEWKNIVKNYSESQQDKKQELTFIQKHFQQRICTKYTPVTSPGKQKPCKCGLPRDLHTDAASEETIDDEWRSGKHTTGIPTLDFGFIEFMQPIYLDLPQKGRKYIRVDSSKSNIEDVYSLLTTHWKYPKPELVISMTGGIFKSDDEEALPVFCKSLAKATHSAKTWLMTNGVRHDSDFSTAEIIGSRYIDEMEFDEKTCMIGIAPWGILSGSEELQGEHMTSEAAYFAFDDRKVDGKVYYLEENHCAYLLSDDGTYNDVDRYQFTNLQHKMEQFFKKRNDSDFGADSTIVILVVLGGDRFSLGQVSKVLQCNIPVVIVNGSGEIANILAEMFKELESTDQRADRSILTNEEKKVCAKFKEKFEALDSPMPSAYLPSIPLRRQLVMVFGKGENEFTDFEKIISLSKEVELKGNKEKFDIAVAANNTIEARDVCRIELKKGRDNVIKLLQDGLLHALEKRSNPFLLLDIDAFFKVDLSSIDLVKWLHTLYFESIHGVTAISKVLKDLSGMTRENHFYDTDGSKQISKDKLLAYVGKIIFKLLGNNFRILYQEDMFKGDTENMADAQKYMNLTPAWHLFTWAVLSNESETAKLLWYHSPCRMGTALMACKMFKEMALKADLIREKKLCDELEENAIYFEDLALMTLDELYSNDPYEAYRNVATRLPFELGEYLTPMRIAFDGGATRFMGHACCQTLLQIIWMNSMDLDTPSYQLLPWVSIFNIHWITFEDEVLKYARLQKKPEACAPNSDEKQTCCVPQRNPRREFIWFCVKSFYTAPVNKFINSFVSYMILLGIFTHFILTELKPLDGISDVTGYEWVLYFWMLTLACQEIKQALDPMTTGPLYKMDGDGKYSMWSAIWSWHERIRFRMFKLRGWFFDVWNFMDGLMLLMFLVSVVLRFSLEKTDFAIVRISFCITMLLYYFRFLKFGYVLQQLGPRIIVIAKMLSDLVYFMVILMVFIISFGVAFQALLDPNKEPSWEMLRNVLWRGYWQMLGEIFLDDATEGMGLEVSPRNCTTNRELLNAQPDIYENCQDWFLPVLLGLFMMITNILLLNLLIAIFSHSFEEAEDKSVETWNYHLYELYYEYYSISWMVPPLNVFWYLVQFGRFLVKKCQQCLGKPTEEKKIADKYAMEDNLFCLPVRFRDDNLEARLVKRHMRDAKKKPKEENHLEDLQEQMQKFNSEIKEYMKSEFKALRTEIFTMSKVGDAMKKWLDKRSEKKNKKKKQKKPKKEPATSEEEIVF